MKGPRKLNNDFDKRMMEEIKLMRSFNDSLERNIKIQNIALVLFGLSALGIPLILLTLIVKG